jgi:trehalose/maltose hydrolase-like predicted phosphorylase
VLTVDSGRSHADDSSTVHEIDPARRAERTIMNAWAWHYEGYVPEKEGLREALCTVGNGYLATRGAAPEIAADGIHHPGTYAAGVYNRRTSEVAGQEIDNESLVNLPNWLVLTFRIEGGPWFSVDDVEVLDHRQTLDIRRAVLTRHVRFRDRAGRTTALTQRRFVSMDDAHACALETTFVAEDWSGELQVRSALDGTVRNTLVERYRDLESDHLDPVRTAELSHDSVLLVVETNQSHIRVAMASRTSVTCGAEQLSVPRRLVERDGWVGQDLTVEMARGEAVTVDKVVAVFTGRDHAISEPATAAARWLPRLGDFDALLTCHVRAWSHLWRSFRIELDRVDGAEERDTTLRTLRLHLLHVLQTVSPNTVDLDVGVPPRGLHGEAYRGHILWDEVFVFPILNLRLPALTRSLLLYRHRRLPEARHAAREAGFDGAMYPWQSGSDGREENQQLHLNPMSGRWLPDPTQRQRHVGIAVAYNVWQYYQATGDLEFLVDHGAEMLVEIARFWSSIATYDHARDRYVIRGVMGPDEFHSGYPGGPEDGIDNNAYTNLMAVWVLLRALEVLELIPSESATELSDMLEVRSDDLDRWRDITRKMYVPFHDDGRIISQFEGYDDLEELDWTRYQEAYGNLQRLDRILEREGDSVNRYKASKQADVLMLFYLLSADELRELFAGLGYRLTPEMIPETVDHYLSRTSHGSTLSSVVHSWVLARSSRERALDLFVRALESDVADIQGGTTAEGVHLGAMAGSVDLLQRCFSGLQLRGGQLVLDPYWPEALGELEFSIRYREHPLSVRITGTTAEVSAGEGLRRSIHVSCRGEGAVLEPGSRVTFPLAAERTRTR